MINNFILAASLALTNAFPTIPYTNSTPPYAPIRECYLGSADNESMITVIDKFASYLSMQPPRNISASMGRYVYSTTIDGICLQLQLTNWDCKYDLPVDGAGLAWTARSIPPQCFNRKYDTGEVTGPFGWAAYTDYETGNTYHGSLWAILTECTTWYPKSACGRVVCPGDNGTVWLDPTLPCPGT